MTGERRLWLVRHGETEGQSSIRYHGSNDVPLSDHGRAQVRELAPWLRGVPFARIVHSPLQRAAESAAILAEACALPRALLVADARLREICFGECEGLTADEIAARFPDFWRRHRDGAEPDFPGGEPRAAFRERIGGAIREWAAAEWRSDLLVVAHRGTVRHALAALTGVPEDGAGPAGFGTPLGSLSVLREDRGWQLELLGAVP